MHPHGEQVAFQLTAHVLGCSVDLPARAMLQNCVQFNGYYGCCACEQPGVSIQTDGGGHVLIYPYNLECPAGPARSQKLCQEYAKQAIEQHSVVCV